MVLRQFLNLKHEKSTHINCLYFGFFSRRTTHPLGWRKIEIYPGRYRIFFHKRSVKGVDGCRVRNHYRRIGSECKRICGQFIWWRYARIDHIDHNYRNAERQRYCYFSRNGGNGLQLRNGGFGYRYPKKHHNHGRVDYCGGR